MSKFTDYGENKIADFWRKQGITLPANFNVVPGSAGSDSGITEITGLGLTPAVVPRSLVKWKSTQDDSLVSTGTSKLTKNTDAISLGTATGPGTLSHIGLKDASNVHVWAELGTPIDFVDGDPVELAAGAVQFKLGRLGGATYDCVNAFLDMYFRAQTFACPDHLGLAYFTTAPTDAGGGVEALGGGYARIDLVPSLSSLSGTQLAGSTSASSGTGGRVSNNATLAHPDPSGDQGVIVAVGVYDALTLGTLLFWRVLATPISVVNGGPAPFYAPDTWALTLA